MTYFSIGGNSSLSMEDVIGLIVFLCILAVVVWALFFLLMFKDNWKPLHKEIVNVLEKPVQQGMVHWYIVESENGERKKLRCFKVNKVLITVGDVGIIEYRGITIQSFKRLPDKIY